AGGGGAKRLLSLFSTLVLAPIARDPLELLAIVNDVSDDSADGSLARSTSPRTCEPLPSLRSEDAIWVTSSSRSVLAAVSRSGASTSSRLAVAAGLLPWISMSSSVAGRSGLASSGCSLPGSSTSFAGAGGGATDLGGAAGSLPLASGSSLSLAARIFAISPAAEGNGALLVE